MPFVFLALLGAARNRTSVLLLAGAVPMLCKEDGALVTIGGDPAKTRNLASVYVRLAPLDKRKRDQFVIKPNDEYGGTGVMLGASVEANRDAHRASYHGHFRNARV